MYNPARYCRSWRYTQRQYALVFCQFNWNVVLYDMNMNKLCLQFCHNFMANHNHWSLLWLMINSAMYIHMFHQNRWQRYQLNSLQILMCDNLSVSSCDMKKMFMYIYISTHTYEMKFSGFRCDQFGNFQSWSTWWKNIMIIFPQTMCCQGFIIVWRLEITNLWAH